MICGKIVEERYSTHTLHARCGLDRGHEGECCFRAYGERLAGRKALGMTLEENIAQLRATNHRLSRDLDRLRKRKVIDSGANIWLPYWRSCKTIMRNLEEDKATIKAQLKSCVIVSETLAEDVGVLHKQIRQLREALAAMIVGTDDCLDLAILDMDNTRPRRTE